jgi:hypothetical protein
MIQTLPKSPLWASIALGFSFGIDFINCIQVILQITQDMVNKRFDEQAGRYIMIFVPQASYTGKKWTRRSFEETI